VKTGDGRRKTGDGKANATKDRRRRQAPAHYRLRVWRESIDLLKSVYSISGKFPAEHRFGLTSQVQRSALSVPSNIAEGAGRGGNQEFIRYLQIARGSLMELDTQLQIASELTLLQESDPVLEKLHRVYAMINKLITVKQSRPPS